MDAEDLLVPLAFFALAGILFALSAWRSRKARKKLAEAAAAPPQEAVELLKQALAEAREDPRLEEQLLEALSERYQAAGVAFDATDYRKLVAQFEVLSNRGTGRAFQSLKKVQELKLRMATGFPRL